MRCLGPSQLVVAVLPALPAFFIYQLATGRGISWEPALGLLIALPVVFRLLRIGIWVHDDEVVMRNAWKTFRAPIDQVEMLAGMVDVDIAEIDRTTGGHARESRQKAGDEIASRKFLRNRLTIDGEQHEIDAMLGRSSKAQAKAAANVIKTLYEAKARRSTDNE